MDEVGEAKVRWNHILAIPCAAGVLSFPSALATPPLSAQAIVERMGLKLGRWDTTSEIVAIEMIAEDGKSPPADVQAKIREKIGTSFKSVDCVGPKASRAADLKLPGITISASCSFADVEVGKAHLQLTASCRSSDGGFKAETRIRTTHTDVAFAADVDTSAFSAGAGYTTKISMKTSSVYSGTCPKS